jgi:hypothetical protein
MKKLTDGLCLSMNTATNKTYALSRSSLKSVVVSKNLEDAFYKVKHKWSVVVSILARSETGKLQVTSHQVILPTKLRKASLAPCLAKLHSQVSYDVRYNHPGWEIENAAWLADPAGGDWSEKDILQALKSSNC